MRFVKLSMRILGFLIVLAVGLPVLVLAALQVPSGRSFVSGVAGSLASTVDRTVRFEDLHVGFGLNAAVGQLEVADGQGTWLVVDDIAVAWHPLSLLSGTVDISSLTAARIDLERSPAVAEPTKTEATQEDAGSSSLALPFDVKLERLAIGEINLGEALLGAPVSLAASGSGALAFDPALITADLDVHRIDGIEAGLTAKAEFQPAAEKLLFDISISEPRGGLAARLLDVAELPALDLTLTGDGPLTDWAANLDIALDGHTTVTGAARIEETDTQRRLTFDLDGDLAPLAPPAAQAFLLGTTKAYGSARFAQDFTPLSAEVTLASETVSLDALADLENDNANVSAEIAVGAGGGALIALDIDARRIAFGPLNARMTVSGKREAADWSIEADLASFRTTELQTEAIRLTASGRGADLRPEELTSPFVLALEIAGLEGLVPEAAPLNGPVTVRGSGSLDGAASQAQLNELAVETAAATVKMTDTDLSPERIAGQGRLSLKDFAVLSELAGRDLGGSVAGSFSADLAPQTLEGSLTASLVTRDLTAGIVQADALLAGESRIDATVELDGPTDISATRLAIANGQIDVKGSARYRDGELSSDMTARLADLTKLDPQLAGRLDVEAGTSGPLTALSVQAQAGSNRILLAGTPLDDLELSAEATANPSAPTAKIAGSASLNGQPLAVDVELASEDGGATLSPLSVRLAGNSVTGTLSLADLDRPFETLKGDLRIDAPDLASLSPLLLTEISGRIEGAASADPDSKRLSLDITGNDLVVPGATVGGLELKAHLAAPYAPESVSADIRVRDLLTDATPIHGVDLRATPDGDGTAIAAELTLESEGKDGLTLEARVSEPESGTYLLALSKLALRYQGLASRLKQPASISYANGVADIEPLELQLGGGSLALAGSAGEKLDLNAELNSVPLDLANAFVPSLGLGGSLSGKVAATGSAAAPAATWTISGSGLTATALRSNGLAALQLSSSGTLKEDRVSQTTRVSDPNGLNLTAAGTIGVKAPNALALTVEGTVPAAALRRPLLEAGIRADGAVSLEGSVGGTAAAPTYRITATPAGLKVTSLSTGLTVQNIRGTATVDQNRASIDGFAGDLATGGSLTASGSIGLNNGFPADIGIKLDQGSYIDPGLVNAEVDADLKISGPLASATAAALINGSVTINKADVSIPEHLPGAIPPVDVRHVNASKAIRQQVAELGGESGRERTQQRSVPPQLDILVSAPGRIFVRGRGLDAELQGNLKIVGTTASPRAIGAFNLKRGQLDILTRRLVFSRGDATFEGSLTPILDFAATTSVTDTTITVSVSGEADDPQIVFSSAPELPQDEVLALLLFGKSIGNLSATQVARLAAAITTLTGGSDSGPLASIRKSLGLDAIDINTDGEDGPSVSVGKYINDNIYVGAEQGTGSGSSRVKVDIDLDRGLKVRGEVGADGSSKAGIFFEREY
jgi:translocation and assembly module TamB